MNSHDRICMKRAIREARKCKPEDDRSHPLVGVAVVTPTSELVTAYRGELEPGQHAEFIALERKLRASAVAGATVYTTLEPCTTRNHPKVPCADRLCERKVRRVWIGILDPDSRICGRGMWRLRDAGIQVQFFPPDLMAEIEDLNREFIRSRTARPAGVPATVTPPEEAALLDKAACETLALACSGRGDHSNAIAWGLRALAQQLPSADHEAAGRIALLLAQQYRHQGLFNESLRYYAIAEEQIRSGGLQGFSPKANLLRITAGRIMVEEFLLQGNARRALRAYKALGQRLREVEASTRQDNAEQRWFEVYRLHWERQKAEMYRQLGQYQTAHRTFRSVYERYNFVEVAPKAWALLGEGEASRLLGQFDDADHCYRGAEQFARKIGDARLLARVLRNKAEVLRSVGGDLEGCLQELKELVAKTGYIFGRVYGLLTAGGRNLSTGDLGTAGALFLEARGLCLLDGQPLGLEAVHAVLGVGETYRLAGQAREAQVLLRQAFHAYRDKGIAWGYLRARLALAQLGGSAPRPGTGWMARSDWAYLQLLGAFESSRELPSVFENIL